ncbi:HlyD family secretion protein [Tranquillimonas rosea]|uniref:Membrane fusion protein (MFP) family protein n=1 Tax=Tranquillimonas rosea TaxID=641238 RepID=A0A1H9W4F3_9RHOB|nr:HlyD family type I secretion periplasmic adaptor subunit [Tranquillimonas rosea]SES28758.1 HlyD family secretion protein [Tranquillimonas rosea]
MTEGTRTWSAMRYTVFGLLALVVLVGGFGTWAATSQISGAVIAPGQIVVERNRQIVQHPDGGVVDEILVDEGDEVEAGEVLIRLDPTLLRSELSTVENQFFEVLARAGRLEAEREGADEIEFDPRLAEAAENVPSIAELIEGQTRLFEARQASREREIEQLGQRRQQIVSQINGIESQQESLEDQLDLIDAELSDQQSLLDRGLAQSSRVLSLRREAARLGGEVGELTASAAEARERATEIEIEILKLDTSQREEAITTLRDLEARLFELSERRSSLKEQLARMEITAPVSGIVYDMQIFAERSVIQAAEPVLYLVPQDRPLVITAQVPPIHIDQVYVGQEVTLRFSALDARTTPELFGDVMQVSADAFVDENSGEAYYRAEIILRDDQTERLPEGATLIPGMPVETFIRTEDRTPLAYLVKPFTDYFAKAFRET